MTTLASTFYKYVIILSSLSGKWISSKQTKLHSDTDDVVSIVNSYTGQLSKLHSEEMWWLKAEVGNKFRLLSKFWLSILTESIQNMTEKVSFRKRVHEKYISSRKKVFDAK